MNEPKLLGATLLHTRYGHWRHPQSGRYFIRPVRDCFHNYPGLVEELMTIRQRAVLNQQTVEDQMRIQWLSQAAFGALDIYQHGTSTQPMNRGDILEEIDDWLTAQLDTKAVTLLASLLTGDNHP
ncbi:MAG: hypothetical protein WAS33_07485 [Candidatus Promineifilaceae bacterium]